MSVFSISRSYQDPILGKDKRDQAFWPILTVDSATNMTVYAMLIFTELNKAGILGIYRVEYQCNHKDIELCSNWNLAWRYW